MILKSGWKWSFFKIKYYTDWRKEEKKKRKFIRLCGPVLACSPLVEHPCFTGKNKCSGFYGLNQVILLSHKNTVKPASPAPVSGTAELVFFKPRNMKTVKVLSFSPPWRSLQLTSWPVRWPWTPTCCNRWGENSAKRQQIFCFILNYFKLSKSFASTPKFSMKPGKDPLVAPEPRVGHACPALLHCNS